MELYGDIHTGGYEKLQKDSYTYEHIIAFIQFRPVLNPSIARPHPIPAVSNKLIKYLEYPNEYELHITSTSSLYIL